MANVEKFVLNETGRLLSHCARTQKNPGSHIDEARTCLNYNLASGLHDEYTDYQFLKHRIHEPGVRLLNRSDVKVACSWCVTIPKDLLDEEPERTREFFEKAYNFFKERHGEENIVSSYVHMDEYKPHMHFVFTPIVEERDRPGYKVCAKEALNGCFGAKFHEQFKEYMSHEMGREINVANGATIEGFKSVEELKRGTAIREVKRLERQIQELEEHIKRERATLRILESKVKHSDTDLTKVSVSGGYAIMEEELWDSIKQKIIYSNMLLSEKEQLNKEIEQLQTENFTAFNNQLKEQNQELQRKNTVIETKNAALTQEVQSMNEFLQCCDINGRNGIELYQEYLNRNTEKGR